MDHFIIAFVHAYSGTELYRSFPLLGCERKTKMFCETPQTLLVTYTG
jgi:hypothetical protein